MKSRGESAVLGLRGPTAREGEWFGERNERISPRERKGDRSPQCYWKRQRPAWLQGGAPCWWRAGALSSFSLVVPWGWTTSLLEECASMEEGVPPLMDRSFGLGGTSPALGMKGERTPALVPGACVTSWTGVPPMPSPLPPVLGALAVAGWTEGAPPPLAEGAPHAPNAGDAARDEQRDEGHSEPEAPLGPRLGLPPSIRIHLVMWSTHTDACLTHVLFLKEILRS